MNAALLLLSVSVLPPPQQGQRPSEGGLEKEQVEALQRMVADWDREDSPGGAVAVVLRGRVESAFAFGMADLAEGLPNTTSTGFYLASVAKPFTAACTALAARRGVLNLDGPVRAVVPELPDVFAKVTFRHLLQHRSGIPDVYDVVIAADLGPQAVSSNGAALALLGHLDRPCFPAGERFLYCNSGYVLLAESITRATGKPFATFAREEVFAPLGMSGTWCQGEPERSSRARIYQGSGTTWEESAIRTGLLGPGGLWSTLDDLSRFECAWQSSRFPDAELRRLLLEAPKGGENPALGGYALGWMIQSLGGRRVERHFGGAFGASADILRLPDEGLAIIVLSNASTLNAPTLARQIAEAVLGTTLEPGADQPEERVQLSSEERARFGRIWLDPANDALWVVTPKPDHFVLATLGDLKLKMEAESSTRLRALDAHLPFAVELEDDDRLVVLDSIGTRARLERIPFPPPQPIPLDEYAGSYSNAALESTISFEAAGNSLRFAQRQPLIQAPPFLPVARDRFLCDLGAQVIFHRDAEDRVSGLTIVVNRGGPLQFVRE